MGRDDPQPQALLRYSRLDDGRLTVSGTVQTDVVAATLRRIDPARKFLLVRRGFHWISEEPFNR
jgi:hypothetical protein